jgi:flagellar biosynthesis chaperone FliJ
VKTPYATLLSVRAIEERQAEADLAAALAGLRLAEDACATLTAHREAWIDGHLIGALGSASFAPAVVELERAEREAEAARDRAAVALEAARTEYLERRRQREVVERLHMDAVARAAREAARREQAELDDLTAIRRRARGTAPASP